MRSGYTRLQTRNGRLGLPEPASNVKISLQKFPLNSGHIRFLLYALGPVFILVSHLGCLLLLGTGLSLAAAGWALALYLIRMLATTAIYHRLITHGSYRAPRLVHWIGSLVGASAGQMGPSWWKAHHLAHHRHVDTDLDPHSPLKPQAGLGGFWRSQVGWLLAPTFFPERLPADVEADPVLRLIDRLHFISQVFHCRAE